MPEFLRFIRQRLGARVHFWPFDGWDIPAGRSTVAEIYPRRCRARVSPAWTAPPTSMMPLASPDGFPRVEQDVTLAGFLRPALTPSERAVADVEGWILGVAWLPPPPRSSPAASRVRSALSLIPSNAGVVLDRIVLQGGRVRARSQAGAAFIARSQGRDEEPEQRTASWNQPALPKPLR